MKITILDGFAANPGDLSWGALSSLGTLTVYERTAPEEVIERAADSEIVLTNKTVIDASTLRMLPKLQYIGVLATGYNVVNLDTATRLGIVVTNIPSYSTMSVAQNVFALLLALTNSAEHYSEEFHAGKWSACPDFSYANTCLTELAGKRFGIYGYGHIGHAVADIAKAFGMEVCVCSSKSQDELPGVTKVSVDELFAECDIVSLHCPLTDDTFHLADASRISTMKPTAILINTGRGPLVDEQALAVALKEGRIAGAGLDVLTHEPPEADNPLIDAPNCIVTPHISWSTKEARQRLLNIAVANLKAFLNGTAQNVVN
ncbi:MAG: D-2-hydroxyacid dehydrogenase [Clostridium sp.]|nr:D-2-hydroxyacid dehydrogenase [Prevotella sp.]MCM1429274.1 D-2-hydroxyacid dehydrogenase [Clostridium sp.]MCM1475693.1 D-2-hydroxyacid dehydrogenase [Muribaculaceae bacterium]